MSDASVFVVNSSHPEVDWLASELSRQGVLSQYVRRYANKDRHWERILASVPVLRDSYASTVGRRRLPPGLSPTEVVNTGALLDFGAAVLLRVGWGSYGVRLSNALLRRRNEIISARGATLAYNARVAVGNYGVSLPTFLRVKASGGRLVLNYPFAHHAFAYKLLKEEMEREPEFASTITLTYARNDEQYDQECELADLILVGSSFVKETFRCEGVPTNKVVPVPYGFDPSVFSPGTSPRSSSGFRALFVGQVGQRKGIAYLLRAFKDIRGTGAELVIAGKFSRDPAPVMYYRELFTYAGNLPKPSLANLYRDCDVFVFPTLIEGMPLVILEAMASGLPVITTANGPGDIVRDGVDGFIVPIRDSNAIAERLEYLRANPAIRLEMGRAARARALEFTWDRYCTNVAKVVLGAADIAERSA